MELVIVNSFQADSEKFVRKLLTNKLNSTHRFHNLNHTESVVDSVLKLCEGEKCTDAEKETVVIAAWFHDTGFTRVYNNHEDESNHIASTFLIKKNYHKNGLSEVAQCIQSTKYGAIANNKIQMILQDADMAHLASENYFDLLTALRKEVELIQGKSYTDKEWLTQNMNFLLNHSYKTQQANLLYSEGKKSNILKNQQLLSLL